MSGTGISLAALLALGAGLAAVVGVELRGMLREGAAVPSPAPSVGTAAVQGAAPAAPANPRAQWVETALARPLFSRDRRAQAQPAAAAAAPAALPRLAGVVIHGAERSAILVPADGSRPVVAREGAQVGPVVIQAIRAGQVTVSGPGGTRVLHLTFGPQRPAETVPMPLGVSPAPGLPGLASPAASGFAR